MSSNSLSLTATVPVPGASQSSIAVNNSRPDADPPDPGRHRSPCLLVWCPTWTEVSSPDVPAPQPRLAPLLPCMKSHLTSLWPLIFHSKPVLTPSDTEEDVALATTTLRQRLLDIWKPTEAFRLWILRMTTS
ncbi:hypothetical protein GQ457_09G013830 [Hibiscus cannabinus]